MATRKKRKVPTRRIDVFRVIAGVWGLFAVYAVFYAFIALSQGRPILSAKTGGWSVRRLFDAYGDSAFAADSANWLAIAGYGVALVLLSVIVVTTGIIPDKESRFPNLPRRLSVAALIAPVVGGIASIGLLAFYQASGVPFRNFQDDAFGTIQPLMYGLSYIIPSVTILGALIIGLYHRKKLFPSKVAPVQS